MNYHIQLEHQGVIWVAKVEAESGLQALIGGLESIQEGGGPKIEQKDEVVIRLLEVE